MHNTYNADNLPTAFIKYLKDNPKLLFNQALKSFYPELNNAINRLTDYHNYHSKVFYRSLSEEHINNNLSFIINSLCKVFSYYLANTDEPQFFDEAWNNLVDFERYWEFKDYKFLARLFPSQVNNLAGIAATNHEEFDYIPSADQCIQRYKALKWFIKVYNNKLNFTETPELFTEPGYITVEARELIEKYYNYEFTYY